MLPQVEQRIVRAVAKTQTPIPDIARAWNVSERLVYRLARKHGIERPKWWGTEAGRHNGKAKAS